MFYVKVLMCWKFLRGRYLNDQELPLLGLVFQTFVCLYLYASPDYSVANKFDHLQDLVLKISGVVHHVIVRMPHPGL